MNQIAKAFGKQIGAKGNWICVFFASMNGRGLGL